MNLNLKKLAPRDRRLYFIFAMLGFICVFNLNAVAGKFFGVERFFSPFILLLCVLGILFSGKKPIHNLGKYGMWFLGGYIAYMAFGTLSAFVESNRGKLNAEILRYTASVAVASATILLGRRLVLLGHTDRIIRFMFWLALASTATIFISYLFPALNAAVGVGHRAGRMSGFFANPNEIATQSLVTTAFGFGLASRTLNIKYLAFTFMVCVPAVLGAHSRSAIVGMACMIALLSFLVFPPKYVIRTALSLMVVGLVAFFGLTYLQSLSEGSQSAGLERRTDQLFDFLRGDIRGATTGGRFDLGNEAIGLWRDKPIIGHGLGFMNEMPVHGVGPHNMIFKMLGDSGLAGVFVMGLFWLFFLMATIRCRIRWLKIMLIGIFLAVSFSLVSSHTGISRRFLVFQLSVMIVMLEPSTQSVIRQGSAGRNFIFFQPPNPTDPRVQYPNVRPGRPLHPSRVR